MLPRVLLMLLSLFFGALHIHAEDTPATGQTRIAKWKDDKTATFLLMFDDSWPSHWQVAGPELVKRGMIATFYICPAKGEHQKFTKEWEETMLKWGMVFGDHTMTHKGVKNLENAEYEIGDCATYIRKLSPEKPDRLVSYGQPGVAAADWNLPGIQLEALLKKHHLIDRPTFDGHGAVYALQTADQMLALADKAIASKGMEYLVIHGVERITPNWGYQDFWPLKQEILFAVLDGLKERRDKGDLWITDHISMHQYETERSTAVVRLLQSTADDFKLELKSQADPKFYDLPITLVTKAPANWQSATVTQGQSKTTVEVNDGEIRFDAVPNGAEIVVKKIR